MKTKIFVTTFSFLALNGFTIVSAFADGRAVEFRSKDSSFRQILAAQTVENRIQAMTAARLDPTKQYLVQYTKMKSNDLTESHLSFSVGTRSGIGLNSSATTEFGWLHCTSVLKNPVTQEIIEDTGKVMSLGYFTVFEIGAVQDYANQSVEIVTACTRLSGGATGEIEDQVSLSVLSAVSGLTSASTSELLPQRSLDGIAHATRFIRAIYEFR